MKAVASARDGSPIYQLALAGGGLSAKLLTMGAALQDLRLDGHPHPLVLGYSNPQDYVANPNYFGAIVGRFANRIRGGRARIGGRNVQLDQNTADGHLLHGGRSGTGHQNWTVLDHAAEAATFGIRLPDGHMGFPGQLEARVTYRLQPGAGLEIAITASSTATTLCSFAHHSYFNLDGAATIAGHELRVLADAYLPIDPTGLPLGVPEAVSGTRFDLRRPRPLMGGAVYDHNFCLPPAPEMKATALLRAGRLELELQTNAPGLQVYTGDGIAPGGPDGLRARPSGKRAGIALEPQIWPDAPNQPDFPAAELRPGETYRQNSQFRFRAC